MRRGRLIITRVYKNKSPFLNEILPLNLIEKNYLIKRLFDCLCSGLLLLLLTPLILLIAIVIRLYLGSPIFFRQERPGFEGKCFQLIKFRTMHEIKDEKETLLPDCKRLTKIGRLLRALSLDELPQLWNVLKGEMSLVGPRPLLKEYLPLYNEQQKKRHQVKPGITGLAQVSGRNDLSWDEKFNLDVWYVNNQSFWLDLKILLLTLNKVIRREGITSLGTVSAEKFMGNE